MNIGDVDLQNKEVKESWMMPHLWRANLTGWRPHMRIDKDNDYSVWVEVRIHLIPFFGSVTRTFVLVVIPIYLIGYFFGEK